MTENMIERVANAMIAINERISHSEAQGLARAAIEAMREPTEAICEAALVSGAVSNQEYTLMHRHMADVWHEMIDAALK